MKKTFALLAAAILTLGLFVFAACDDTPENNSQTGGEGETVKTVTAEEWTAAFATANFTNSTIQGSSTMSQGEISETSTTEWEMDGDKIKETNSVVDGANGADYITYYYEKTDNDYNMYVQSETGGWTTRPIGQATSPLEDILEYFNVAKNAYTSVTFDEQKDGYYASTYMTELAGTSTVLTDLLVKFSDKKITGISYSAVSGDITRAMSFTVSAYGTTSVTLPTVTPQKMPESEWDAAFAEGVFDNFTSTTTAEGAVVSVTKATKDGDTKLMQITFGGVETYFEITPGAIYQYTQQNGEWVKSVADEFIDPSILFAAMAAGYDDAVYDAENDTYTLTGLQAGPTTFDSTVIKFADGKVAETVSTTKNDNISMVQTVVYSDYGTTSVTLPQVPEIPQKMTEKEWLAAFDEENFKNYTEKTITDVPPSPIVYTVMRYVTDGDVTLLHYQTDSNRNTYYEVTPDGSFIYEQQDGVWTKEIYDSYVIDNTLRETIAASYDQAVFNAETNEYVFTDFNVTALDNYLFTFNSVTVSFADGKLAEITCYRDFGNGITNTHIYSDYGTTVIALPAIPAKPDMEKQEWEDIFFRMLEPKKITLNRTVRTAKGNVSSAYVMQYDIGANDGHGNYILHTVKEQGTSYEECYYEYKSNIITDRYRRNDREGEYTRSAWSGTDPLNTLNRYFTMFGGAYDFVTAAGEEGCYTAAEAELPFGASFDLECTDISICFENGKVTECELTCPTGDPNSALGVQYATMKFTFVYEIPALTLPTV